MTTCCQIKYYMDTMERSESEQILTDIILDIFQLNGLLIQEGDKLTKDLELTSARWKILGALSLATKPMTVSDIAKTMGQTRQAVQRLANEMKDDGFLHYDNNPRHKRAKVLILESKGKEYFKLLEERQIRWVNSLSKGLTKQKLEMTTKTLRQLIDNIGS